MSVFLGAAAETEGRRAPQTRLLEGGRYLSTPPNRSSATAAGRPARHHEADGVLLTQPAVAHDQPKPSPFSVSHFRGALHLLGTRQCVGCYPCPWTKLLPMYPDRIASASNARAQRTGRASRAPGRWSAGFGASSCHHRLSHPSPAGGDSRERSSPCMKVSCANFERTLRRAVEGAVAERARLVALVAVGVEGHAPSLLVPKVA